MKLFELFTTTKQDPRLKVPFDQGNINRDARNTDLGAYAYAKQLRSDPHQISLRQRQPLEKEADIKKDPKYAWAQTAIEYATDNPFFPRIYDLTVKTDPSGRKLPRYRMEKLQHLDSLPTETLIGMYDSLFNDEAPFDPTDSPTSVATSIARKINGAVENNNLNSIENEELKDLISVLANMLIHNENFYADIHRNNIMVRGTSVGPQLVITDPIANLSSSHKKELGK